MSLEWLVAAEENLERLLWPGTRPFSTKAHLRVRIDLALGDERGGMRLIRSRVALKRPKILRVHLEFIDGQFGNARRGGRHRNLVGWPIWRRNALDRQFSLTALNLRVRSPVTPRDGGTEKGDEDK